MRTVYNTHFLKLCLGSIFICIILSSCMSARYDMRKLEQPVMMNGNPFVCEQSVRPTLTIVDNYSAMIFTGTSATSQSSSSSSGNEAQVKAFQKIGGDPLLTITDVKLDTESLCINMLLGLMEKCTIQVNGKVKKINKPTASDGETVK